MGYVKFETTLEKPIAELPQLDGLVGRKIEIIVLESEVPGEDAERTATPPRRRGGWAKGRISMSSDFDEPLDDFKDYM